MCPPPSVPEVNAVRQLRQMLGVGDVGSFVQVYIILEAAGERRALRSMLFAKVSELKQHITIVAFFKAVKAGVGISIRSYREIPFLSSSPGSNSLVRTVAYAETGQSAAL